MKKEKKSEKTEDMIFNPKYSLKKNYKFYVTVIISALFIATTLISVGFGALNKNLSITGELEYEKLNVQADNVSYNNAASGTTATNVQEALDELYSLADDAIFTIYYYTDSSVFINATDPTIVNKTYKLGMSWKGYINSSYNSNLYVGANDDYGDHTNNIEYAYGWVRNTPDDSISTNFEVLSNEIEPRIYYVFHDMCCFDPETLITIDFEGHTKKIKDFEVGDQIVVENVKTGKKQITTVVKDASIHPVTLEMTDLVLEDGTILKFNSYHPIYTTEGYKSVTNYNNYPTLKEGDYTVDIEGNKKKIKKIKNYDRREHPIPTYNLLIKGVKEEFLEEEYAYFANGVLVHTGIAKYDDEEHYRATHKDRCKYQELYKDFNFDKATNEEITKFLIDLYFTNEEAEIEYIKYYINAKQYFRYTKFAKDVKNIIKAVNTSILNKYDKNSKISFENSTKGAVK